MVIALPIVTYWSSLCLYCSLLFKIWMDLEDGNESINVDAITEDLNDFFLLSALLSLYEIVELTQNERNLFFFSWIIERAFQWFLRQIASKCLNILSKNLEKCNSICLVVFLLCETFCVFDNLLLHPVNI